MILTILASSVLFRGFDFAKCASVWTRTGITSLQKMLGLLLLLFYPHSWAEQEQVCFNFTKYQTEITIKNATIIDQRFVSCLIDDIHECVLVCPYTRGSHSWFNGQSACLEAIMSPSGENAVISIPHENILCTLYPCTNTSVLKVMNSLREDKEGLVELFYVRKSCPSLFSKNSHYKDLKKMYVWKEQNMIHSVIETPEANPHADLRHMSINAMNISGDELMNSSIDISVPQLSPQHEPYIPKVRFPSYALREIPETKRVIGTVSYRWHDHFEFHPVIISSMVIRLELLEGKLQNLSTPIEMVFPLQNVFQSDSVYACHFFDDHDFVWKTDGCETEIMISTNGTTNVICSCDHMTPFAVLLIRIPIDPIHWQILSYISYIGCGLSAFFTALSIVIYFFSYKKADHSIAIHVSLSGALFLLNTTFLLTEWGTRVEPEWLCVFVAAAMHYSLLCSFTWMALEAVHLYLLLIKVFNTNYKHYMVKMSVAGWGIPAIIVSVSAGVKNNDFYGLTETKMADSNLTSAICWIKDDSYFYSVNLVYFTLIFMFNSGILMAVASSICKMKQVFRNVKVRKESKDKQWRDPDRFTESCKSGLTVLGLTCLMGTTWGLAFLGSGFVNYPILYLFCIFNSTQGFFIFIWICLSTNKQRKREQEDKMTSSRTKTSTTKTE